MGCGRGRTDDGRGIVVAGVKIPSLGKFCDGVQGANSFPVSAIPSSVTCRISWLIGEEAAGAVE